MTPDERRPHLDRDVDPELNSLLGALDHAVPRVSAHTIAARARARRSPWLRRAAVVVLALGAAGAAWALPGSPLPRWMESMWGAEPPVSPVATASPTMPAPAIATEPGGAGLALDPTTAQVVAFAPAANAVVEVRITAAGDVIVLRHVSGAARFSAEADHVRVDDIAPGTRFEVDVPAAAAGVELRVGASVIWRGPADGAASPRSFTLER